MIRKLAIAAVLLLCGTSAQADDNQFFNVAIDGYCTTFFIHVQGILVSGTRGGTCEEPAAITVEGGVVATVDNQTGVVMSETDNGKVFTWLFTQPVDGAGEVFVVRSDGKSSRRSARGTYHILHRQPARGEKRSGPDLTAEALK